MSYRINRTDGELLVDLTDGIIDTTTTDITLIGKNYKGFGEWINENFVKILENFAATSQPSNPLIGQLWYDKQDQRLKVYDGIAFRSAAGTTVSPTQPSNLTSGDLWIDNENNKLYIFDGTDLILIGPDYTAAQGKSGLEAASQLDTTDTQRTILKLFLGGLLVGIYSPETFIIPLDKSIAGLSPDPTDTNNPKRQKLYKGFNPANLNAETGIDGFWWRGTSLKAKQLIDDAGVARSAANFLPSDSDGVTTGSLRIKNTEGLSVGIGDTEYAKFKISGTTTIVETQQSNADFAIRTRIGSSFSNSIFIDASEAKIGLFNTNPAYELDVNGDVNVRGNLFVSGDATYINATTLRVEDKNIELGILNDSTESNDLAVDGGGIILRSNQGSKDLTWSNTTKSWTSNQDIDLITTPTNPIPSYKIDGVEVLSATEIGAQVTTASGLVNIGTLSDITIDDIFLDSATIARINGSGLSIAAGGDLIIDNNKIVGVADPTNSQDVATKNYVDTQISAADVLISLDVTGLSDPDDIFTNNGPVNSIITMVQVIKPANSVPSGTNAKIFTVSYSNSTVSGINITVSTTPDSSGVLEKSYVSVRDAADTGSESVVQDIQTSSTASGVVALTATRYVYTLSSNGVIWSYSTRVSV